MNGLRKQVASDGHWLYYDVNENYRNFSKFAYLSPSDTPLAECTDEEKTAWLKEHGINTQVTEAEVVE